MAAVNSSSTWQAPIKSDENQMKIRCSAVFELLSGGKLQLALNHGLCVDATGGQLHLASCEKSHALQEFSLKDELLHVGHKNHCCLDRRGDLSTFLILSRPFEAISFTFQVLEAAPAVHIWRPVGIRPTWRL